MERREAPRRGEAFVKGLPGSAGLENPAVATLALLAVQSLLAALAMDAGGSVGIPLPHGPTSLAAPGTNPDPSLHALMRTQ